MARGSVVASTLKGGIGLGGKLPWKIPDDMKCFEFITKHIGRKGKLNGVIMGRRTWESLPPAFKPLPDRSNCIVSTNSKLRREVSNVPFADSLDQAIEIMERRCDDVYIIGGARLYDEAHRRKLVDRIFWTRVCCGDAIKTDTHIDSSLIISNYDVTALTKTKGHGTLTYDFVVLNKNEATPEAVGQRSEEVAEQKPCKQIPPWLSSWIEFHSKAQNGKMISTRSLTPSVTDIETNAANLIRCEPLRSIAFNGHEETQYLNILSDIMDSGLEMNDRTGVGTFAKWGVQMRYDLRHSFPMLTTKRVYWKGVVEELLWFLKGYTDARLLAAKDVHIWDANGTKEFLAKRGLGHREEGDLGPVYGFQWRHFGADYRTCKDNYEGKGVDQIRALIENINTDPYSRRMIISAWNPAALQYMALPPCHILAQFVVNPEAQELSCIMYQRSADWGLGVPFNIASYSLLTLIIGKLTGLKPREFVHVVGNAHVYKDHVEALKIQLTRVPKPFPIVTIKSKVDDVDKLKSSDFKLIGYDPWPVVKMRMADSLVSIVKKRFDDAIKKWVPDITDEFAEPIVSFSNPKFGDFQCNNAMTLFKNKAKIGGKLEQCKSPKEVGENLCQMVDPYHEGELLFFELKASPQGFITVKIDNGWLERRLTELMKDTSAISNWLKSNERPRKVAIDFSSPNVAKDMHVGHLRSTIHGDAMSRVMEAVGHDVTRINHYGDWGTQFGMLIQYMVDHHPDFRTNPPPLSDLSAFYKLSKKEFDTNDEFKERARKMVVNLQAGDPTAVEVWKLLVDISFRDYSKIYKRLNISDKLIPRGESWYNDMLPDIVQKCRDKGIVQESDGALCIFVEEQDKRENEIPLMIVKSDGGYGYDTTDMAAIYHRVVLTGNDWLVYVTDVGQEGHFLKLFKAATMMGWIDPLSGRAVRTDHMGLGLVCGEDGKKFKTRSGDVVKLTDLLDEAVSRAMAELKARRTSMTATAGPPSEEGAGALVRENGTSELNKKSQNQDEITSLVSTVDDCGEMEEDLMSASEKIGYAAVKYFDLKQVRTGNYKFSFEKMLDPKGNTAVYLLYMYARVCSIFRKATIQSTSGESAQQASPIKITQTQERAICLILLKYKDVIQATLKALSCHHLCDFVYELSVAFSDFYKDCKIIKSPEESSRLALCGAVQAFLSYSFNLLGIKPLTKL